ncbi:MULTISPECIES: peptide MFS transporter [unclassified Carboxylicivirga]|uniref:peptide MFS transporter n=1 Tax=Carboxylicivirga TaxID=1628153 RepID=UPI003D34F612
MFKGHPKGLISASLSNMGERFGFYTMMAILVLFLQAKYNMTGTDAGIIYSVFYFLLYILALVGGIIADKTGNYKGTITSGLVMKVVGAVFIAYPTVTPVANVTVSLGIICFGLFLYAFGTGLFKGNLQALVGQMYDHPDYKKMRDSGFVLFYAFINVGAIFAPLAAIGVRNWWLSKNNFLYNSSLPEYCHSYLEGTINSESIVRFQEFADAASGTVVNDLAAFSTKYLNVFTTGFHYAFGIAALAMVTSLVIFLINKRTYPDPKSANSSANEFTKEEVKMEAAEIRQRMYALFAVFGVVIFFWFSFHQNGLTLTYFARDYTDLSVISFKILGISFEGAEIFQVMNPFFVVFLSPIVVGLFGWLRAKGLEPSTPKKIAIGMAISALGFVVMMIGSFGLPLFETISPSEGGIALGNTERVTPMLLIGTYFILTIAELFISPMGISFVSKVAPPHLQGLMQGGWLGATALGNGLLFIGAIFYESIPLWATWSIFVVVCVISMLTMLFMLKWLERVSK